jgi:hypothetical protein
MLSLHAANAIALSMLFLTGLSHGRSAGVRRPWITALLFTVLRLLWSLRPPPWAADQGGDCCRLMG